MFKFASRVLHSSSPGTKLLLYKAPPRATSSFLTKAFFSSSSARLSRNMGYDTITLKEASDLRRSIYQLSKTSSVSDAKLKEIIEHAITTVPSSFNSQSTRLVVLVREDHDKFWDLVHNIVKELAPPDAQEKTAARMAMFKGAFGTVRYMYLR